MNINQFLDWLISMDDPDDEAGKEARRTVTLTKIIDNARTARGSTVTAPTCRICDEPVVFVPVLGWTHMTLQQLDHEVSR